MGKHFCDTYSRDYEGATDVLYVGLDLAGDVQLVAVESDSLAIRLKIFLRRRIRTLRKQYTCQPLLKLLSD